MNTDIIKKIESEIDKIKNEFDQKLD